MSNKISQLEEFSKAFGKLNQSEQNEFSRITNKLLNKTFIMKCIYSDQPDYYFLCENKELFIPYLDLIDYDLTHDMSNELFYISSKLDRNRLHLNKFDTAIILVLRQLYYVKSKELTSDNRIITSLYEIMEKIRTSNIFSEDKKMTHYEIALKKLRTYKIVDFSSSRFSDDINIQILPSIAIVVPQNSLEEICTRIANLNQISTEEGGDENEASDED